MNIKGCRITINEGKCAKLDQAKIQALRKTADYLKGEIVDAQVIPFDKGTLQNTATFVDESEKDKGKVAIVSSTPYARRLYYHPEYNFQKTKNPNAQGEWFKPFLEGGDAHFNAKEIYKKFYQREANLK